MSSINNQHRVVPPTILSDNQARANSDETTWTELTVLAQTVTVVGTEFIRLWVEGSLLITIAGYINVGYSVDAGAVTQFANPYAIAAVTGYRVSLKRQITGMAAGAHTIHTWFRRAVAAGTAYFYGADPGSPQESWLEIIF